MPTPPTPSRCGVEPKTNRQPAALSHPSDTKQLIRVFLCGIILSPPVKLHIEVQEGLRNVELGQYSPKDSSILDNLNTALFGSLESDDL